MRAVIVKPNVQPEVVEIENTLESLQAIVGGYIETLSFKGGLVLVCNEEGKLRGLPLNRDIGFDCIAGDFLVVASDDEGDFVSLTDSKVKAACELFRF